VQPEYAPLALAWGEVQTNTVYQVKNPMGLLKRSGMVAILGLGLGLVIACSHTPQRDSAQSTAQVDGAREWGNNLTLYEVNVRQFTPEGTFAAFAEHLPRLKDLGVGIIWLMPIHPIGEKNRKGELGSYYAVRDYLGINAEFGTLADLKNLVGKAHDLGMYVIIDWVGNHTAWDNSLATEHPDWYVHDKDGDFVAPVADWADVIHLDYKNTEMRRYMIDALAYWVREVDIDGYRCDVAHMVPVGFWEEARRALDAIKPVFMLAEAEGPEYHRFAFDSTYAWALHGMMNELVKGKKTLADLEAHMAAQLQSYPEDAYQMMFTSNHDENTWNGTVDERLGPAAEVFAVFAGTVPGIPLIYGGQEAGLNKRLKFFDKDLIDWREDSRGALYRALVHLKRENPALWHGKNGGDYTRLQTGKDAMVLGFMRSRGEHQVLVILNFSAEPQEVTLSGKAIVGTYTDLLGKEVVVFGEAPTVELEGWGYLVLTQSPASTN